ncbi:DUF3379 family protein [Beggiatoa alba]|nr:DUF3379 family protein [Beggiatoa alba]
MNCIDVHRMLTADPTHRDQAILSHLAQCSACTRFAKSNQQFEQSLHNAANLEIPDGLAKRILLKQNFKQQHQQRHQRFKFVAVAASMLLALSVSLNFTLLNTEFNHWLNGSLSLEEVAIQHVADELDHLSENKAVKLASLNTLLRPFNLKFNRSIGQLNYVSTCPIRNSRGVHIVLQNKKGLATVLVMPGEYTPARTTYLKGDFQATIIPVKNGSIAIIAYKESEPDLLQNLEKELANAIQTI